MQKALLEEENANLRFKLNSLEQQLNQLQQMIFGSRHGRFVPTPSIPSQLAFDIEAEIVTQNSIMDAKKISYTKTLQKSQTQRRILRDR
ncbi:hypothetical protein [Flavitalea sp.]|nr:hypothetical protein [Flavitalea sp.]